LPTTSEATRRIESPLPDDVAVECRDLYKTYRLGEELSLQKSIASLPFVPMKAMPIETLDALAGVTFSVPTGAFFGIVGANGSGKSTLTQIVSGIAVPTGGRVRVRGRVLPLLEVGAGFHHELTGRQNVQLLGTILGLPNREIEGATPGIAAFAGLERHMETPIKRYSSGMQARLSFGVAMNFPAQIYVFDEVLAVVDDDFRDRGAQALRELNARGRTIIFMSHDLDLVRSLCDTGMWLDKGHVRLIGPMQDVAAAYSSEPHLIVAD
jgi:ABC-type polysaccharide/polyol phosphate transport system ATPase subunit